MPKVQLAQLEPSSSSQVAANHPRKAKQGWPCQLLYKAQVCPYRTQTQKNRNAATSPLVSKQSIQHLPQGLFALLCLVEVQAMSAIAFGTVIRSHYNLRYLGFGRCVGGGSVLRLISATCVQLPVWIVISKFTLGAAATTTPASMKVWRPHDIGWKCTVTLELCCSEAFKR